MGDAGPPTPPPVLAPDAGGLGDIDEAHSSSLREIKVLVTGFGVGDILFSGKIWLLLHVVLLSLFSCLNMWKNQLQSEILLCFCGLRR